MSLASTPIAIVAYQGVLADETEAFRDVLVRVPGALLVTIGERRGDVAGPGGTQVVDTVFDDVDQADVVVVPGGLGTHRHPEIARWLRRVHPRWVLTSSTGSALLAASGLLAGRTAATHWLAAPLLERHGVTASNNRLVIDEPYVTCAGLASTYDAAYVVARSIGGPTLERTIRHQISESATARPDGRERPQTSSHSRAWDTDVRFPVTRGASPVELELEVNEPRRRHRRRE